VIRKTGKTDLKIGDKQGGLKRIIKTYFKIADQIVD